MAKGARASPEGAVGFRDRRRRPHLRSRVLHDELVLRGLLDALQLAGLPLPHALRLRDGGFPENVAGPGAPGEGVPAPTPRRRLLATIQAERAQGHCEGLAGGGLPGSHVTLRPPGQTEATGPLKKKSWRRGRQNR